MLFERVKHIQGRVVRELFPEFCKGGDDEGGTAKDVGGRNILMCSSILIIWISKMLTP